MKSDAKSSIIVYVLTGVVPATSYVALAQLYPTGAPEANLRQFSVLALLLPVLLWVVATLIFGFALGGRRANALLVAVSALGGICLGVIANANYDFYARNVDHNLFPFEIVIWAFLTVPGVIVGWATRQLRHRKKSKE